MMYSSESCNNKNIDILFFERPVADLKKFALKIAKILKSTDSSLYFGTICIEKPSFKNDIDEFIHWNKIKNNIDSFLTQRKVKLVVFSNYRIPDIEFILHAKKLGIRTIMIQEGLVYDGININDVNARNILKSFTKYLWKSISYVATIKRICNYTGYSFSKMIVKIMSGRKNITLIISHAFSAPIVCDFVFIMGEYWRNYYCNKVGYSKDAVKIVGDYDLDDLTLDSYSEPAICYIATIMVEDGNIGRKDFLKFINILANCVDKQTKIYIKLHPRSDKTLYRALSGHNIEYIEKPSYLPEVNLYIGHRGSLIGKGLYLSDNLIIWHFPKDGYCFYEQYATAVCSEEEELKRSIKQMDILKRSNEKRGIISNVYWKNPIGAINDISGLIYKYYKCGKI